MIFQQSRLMKMIGSAIICTSLASIAGCEFKHEFKSESIPSSQEIEKTIESKVQERVKKEIEKYTKSPLEGKEAYEIESGRYSVFFEDNNSCSPPFKDINAEVGRVYLIRTESKNQFKIPLKIIKDYMDRYSLEVGDYKIWIENKGFYAPIDEIKSEEKIKKEGDSYKSYKEKGRLILFKRKQPEENVNPVPAAPAPNKTFAEPLVPVPAPEPAPAPAPAPKPSANPNPLMPTPSRDRVA